MDINSTKLVRWNPTTSEYNKNPYINLEECLKYAPVQQTLNGEWVLFKHEHVKQLLRDPTVLTSNLSGFFEKKESVLLKNTNQCPFLSKSTKRWLMYQDGDEHKKARELVEKTLKCYDLESIVGDCGEKWLTNFFREEQLDIAFAASVLPSLIFRSFYQPIGDEWFSFEELRKICGSLGRSQDLYVSIKQYQEYNSDAGWLFTSISKDFEESGKKGNSLVTNFIRINEEIGNPFTNDELVSIVMGFFLASMETTIDTITSCIIEFLKNPSLLDYILSADAKQINILVEELFRFASPQQCTVRITTQPIEIESHLIPAYSRISLCLASANRDPAVFEDPHQILTDRSSNPHLTFSSGVHACPGAKLARMELRSLLKPLAGILKNYRLDNSREIIWKKAIFKRGAKNLWITKK